MRLLLAAALALIAMPGVAQKKAPKAEDPSRLTCEAQWKLYRESEACFARYRSGKKLAAGAHSRCTEVRQPQC